MGFLRTNLIQKALHSLTIIINFTIKERCKGEINFSLCIPCSNKSKQSKDERLELQIYNWEEALNHLGEFPFNLIMD